MGAAADQCTYAAVSYTHLDVYKRQSRISGILEKNADSIEDYVIENDCRNSAIPLLDMKNIKARIEPGAVIRDKVDIGDNAVCLLYTSHLQTAYLR